MFARQSKGHSFAVCGRIVHNWLLFVFPRELYILFVCDRLTASLQLSTKQRLHLLPLQSSWNTVEVSDYPPVAAKSVNHKWVLLIQGPISQANFAKGLPLAKWICERSQTKICEASVSIYAYKSSLGNWLQRGPEGWTVVSFNENVCFRPPCDKHSSRSLQRVVEELGLCDSSANKTCPHAAVHTSITCRQNTHGTSSRECKKKPLVAFVLPTLSLLSWTTVAILKNTCGKLRWILLFAGRIRHTGNSSQVFPCSAVCIAYEWSIPCCCTVYVEHWWQLHTPGNRFTSLQWLLRTGAEIFCHCWQRFYIQKLNMISQPWCLFAERWWMREGVRVLFFGPALSVAGWTR